MPRIAAHVVVRSKLSSYLGHCRFLMSRILLLSTILLVFVIHFWLKDWSQIKNVWRRHHNSRLNNHVWINKIGFNNHVVDIEFSRSMPVQHSQFLVILHGRWWLGRMRPRRWQPPSSSTPRACRRCHIEELPACVNSPHVRFSFSCNPDGTTVQEFNVESYCFGIYFLRSLVWDWWCIFFWIC